jgi:hypothetical protein
MVIRASPKSAGDGKFFTVLPAKAEDEMDMVVAAIAMLGALCVCTVFAVGRVCGDGLRRGMEEAI